MSRLLSTYIRSEIWIILGLRYHGCTGEGQPSWCDRSAQLVVSWKKLIPNKCYGVQEGPELDCPVVYSTLGVLERPETEVQAKLDQSGNMTDFGVGGGGCHGHNGLDDAKGEDLLLLDRGVLDTVGFTMIDKAPVQSRVRLGVCKISCVKNAIQDVGHYNHLPCLRK